MSAAADRCSGCGLEVAAGTDGCQAIFEEMIARDFSDVTYFRMHRMLVDTYALQHPERYCASVKSFAAHFMGLCWLLEHDVTRAQGSDRLRRWLERAPRIEKPPLPEARGALTIAAIRAADGPAAHGEAVERWARCTWQAYAGLHALARDWIRQAEATATSRPGRSSPPSA